MVDYAPYVALLRDGGVLACPTETSMGLLADAQDADAVQRVCELKQRPAQMPIALLIPDAGALASVATSVSPACRVLAARHWPGPLTLLVPAEPGLLAPLVLNGRVGVRVPGPSPALGLVRAYGAPLTATSANLSGQPPVVDGPGAWAAFGSGLAAVVPGRSPGGPPSTVVDAGADPPRVIRQGAVVL